MTIPELEEGLHVAHKAIAELRQEKHALAEDLSELRGQLGIQPVPKTVCPAFAPGPIGEVKAGRAW